MLLNSEGRPVSGTFDTPSVPRSQLPALIGLNAARESRMIIDTTQNVIYMAGPGGYDLMQALPPGTQQFNCILAPSGHMMVPCAEFPTIHDVNNRGILRLTPELALPVEIMPERPLVEQESSLSSPSPPQRSRAWIEQRPGSE